MTMREYSYSVGLIDFTREQLRDDPALLLELLGKHRSAVEAYAQANHPEALGDFKTAWSLWLDLNQTPEDRARHLGECKAALDRMFFR